MKLAGAMDAQAPKTTRLATGFGRGVRVTRRRRGVSQVTSTGSTARRVITRAYASMTRRQEHRALERAESHAEEALDDRLRLVRPRRNLQSHARCIVHLNARTEALARVV